VTTAPHLDGKELEWSCIENGCEEVPLAMYEWVDRKNPNSVQIGSRVTRIERKDQKI